MLPELENTQKRANLHQTAILNFVKSHISRQNYYTLSTLSSLIIDIGRRSSFDTPRSVVRTTGDRAFPAAASRTWNSLPPEVTRTLSTFKSTLKTYLFSLYFPGV